MCSLSWVDSGDKLSITFSRDEQIARVEAIPPKIFSQKNNDTIMPIDPQGNGSWISVNQNGIVLALLNYYQYQAIAKIDEQFTRISPNIDIASQDKQKFESQLKSRGLLVKNLSQAEDWKDILLMLKLLDLHHYQAFSLAFISKSVKRLVQWNGKQMATFELPHFYTSSAFNTESVCAFRQKAFKGLVPLNEKSLNSFHRSHQDRKGEFSICMHREDAKTVSLSHVEIDRETAIFNYWNGSPCEDKLPTETIINLKTVK